MTRATLTRGMRAANWIERNCACRGRPVRLTPAELETISHLYDEQPDALIGAASTVPAPLSTYLAALHLLGPEWSQSTPPAFATDLFSLWQVVRSSPTLRPFVQRHGERIVVPELGIAWSPPQPSPPAAA